MVWRDWMKITVTGISFTGCNDITCFKQLWPLVNGTYIQEEKIKTLQSDRPQLNSSIKELLHSCKPPNLINTGIVKN
jgi:UDP-glucose 6-dehydrogenase